MKIEAKKIINFFKSLPKKIALHFFWSFIVVFVLSLLVGLFVFYKCSNLERMSEGQYVKKNVRFQKNTYEKVVSYWKEMEENLANIELHQYKDPFSGEVLSISGSTTATTSTSTSEEIQENPPEPCISCSIGIQRLLAAKSLFEFYSIKGEKVPYLWQRAQMWEDKGLGSKDQYKGTKYQNLLLLEKLKEELTH